MPESAQQEIKYFDAKYLDPKYPIVKTDPSVDDVIKSLRTSDYMFVGGSMAGCWADASTMSRYLPSTCGRMTSRS